MKLYRVIFAFAFALGIAAKSDSASIGTANLLSGSPNVNSSSQYSLGLFPYSAAVDGTTADFVFADGDPSQRLVIGNFNSGVGLIRLWRNLGDPNRVPSSISISSSTNNNTLYTDTFGTSLLPTTPLTNASYDANGMATFLVNAPAGTQSLLLNFGGVDTLGNPNGDRIAEVQAFDVQQNTTVNGDDVAFTIPATNNLALTSTVTQVVGGAPAYGTIGNLNNGTMGASLNAGDIVGWDGQANATVQFALGGNPGGYNVSELSVYAGWNDNRVDQAFTVLYHTVGAGSYSTLGSITYTPGASGNTSTRVTLTLPSDQLSGIDGIQIRFDNNGFGPNASAYREVAIIGVAVPEPTSLIFLACGGVAMLWFRKRRT